jgi:hypothetical protein
MVPTGRIIRWKLEAESYSWPQTFTIVSVNLLLCFSQLLEQLHFSSQFVPIHSPLISSIVDFVCSSDQAAQELILLSPFGVPYGLNWASSFSFSGVKVVLSLALVCCYQSPQIGCDFVTVNYINFLWRPLAIFRSGIFHCGASRNLNRFNFPDHIPSWLRSSRSFLRLIFLDPLSPSNKEFALSFFFLEFFLAQKSSFDGAPRRGEGRVIGYQVYA